jgi:error-prone DNA polymerase
MPEQPDPKIKRHPWSEFYRDPMGRSLHAQDEPPKPPPPCRTASCQYADVYVTSNYSFLRGASHPDELIEQAALLGHSAIAITDRNSLAGIVRAHVAAKELGVPLVVGCHLVMETNRHEGTKARRHEGTEFPQHTSSHSLPSCLSGGAFVPLNILVYPTDIASYGRLCRLLTIGKRRTEKGQCDLSLHDLIEHSEGLLAVAVPPPVLDQSFIEVLEGLRRTFDDDRLSLAASHLYGENDRGCLQQLASLSQHVRVPMVATNDVHYHVPERRPLQDVLTCIHHGCTISQAGFRLFANAERCLKSPEEMARLFAAYPEAIERTLEIAQRSRGFNLDQLRYQYPDEICPTGRTPIEYLADLTWRGAMERYGSNRHEGTEARRHEGTEQPLKGHEVPSHSVPSSLRACVPSKVLDQITHELKLIDELNYAPYFLTVYDLVIYARSQGILCQGRGAAANSAVCYCLGITSVDPDRIDVLFERFISKERNEPPDIDIDFEHERREEVIQYIYRKYGRDRAALTAEVITYRGRSAVRDVGKAMGLSLDCVDLLAKDIDWWSDRVNQDERLRAMGLDPNEPTIQRVMALSQEILGFPRHLSQHVGGFVITRGPLCEIVPVENAAMDNRTVIEWDKDDIDAMGMLKMDVLGLGMLTCIGKAFGFINRRHEGTEARRHEGVENENGRAFSQENHNVRDQDLSRPHRMAEEHDSHANALSGVSSYASHGTIRIDHADAACSDIDSFQHRRGLCAAEHGRLHQTSPDCARLTGGTFHAVRTGDQSGHAQTESASPESARRNGSRASRTHPQSGKQAQEIALRRHEGTEARRHGEDEQFIERQEAPSHFVPSCLRASVPSRLPLQLHTVPPEDPAVYDMICAADTIGVFQIESRAQMTMLPRLKPRCFYDLVIEVAIVRPGPIQGDMVHPYLRRRNGEEPVTYPKEEVRRVLGKTLGVPLFQEQAMSLAIVAAGFSAGEADQLRRAMAAWKRTGDKFLRFEDKFINGMLSRGYERDFAQRCFNQLKGFSEYGFPESHAASFALLVYVSAWLKKHHPAAFAAALINSQPMGFYAPAQIVRDAQEHGVEVRPVDVNWSAWDCTLENKRHEGTEARRHEGMENENGRTSSQENHNVRDQDLSRPHRMAEEHGSHSDALSGVSPYADHGTIRADHADAPRSDLDSFQHRRGLRTAKHGRLHQVSADCSRLIGGVVHPIRAGDRSSHDRGESTGTQSARGNRSRASRTHPQPGEQAQEVIFNERHEGAEARRHEGIEAPWEQCTAPSHSVPSCLCASVPSPARASVPPYLRLGLRLIKGLQQTHADAIAAARRIHGPFNSIDALRRASGVPVSALRRLAKADAFGSMGLDRQSALWHVQALRDEPLPMFSDRIPPSRPNHDLPPVSPPRKVIHDYDSIGLSLKAHPLSFLREMLNQRRVTPARELSDEQHWAHGTRISVAGVVLVRQRPATAAGLIFMTIEDETGIANLIVRPNIYERYRQAARHGVGIVAHGMVERQGAVVHVLVRRLESMDDQLRDLLAPSRDFH